MQFEINNNPQNMYEHLKIEERGHVAIMTISAPKSLNALNSTSLGEIDEYLDEFENGGFRCLIVTGDGEKSFVAGADISEMATLGPQQGETFGKKGAEVFRRIETLPCPVIAAVNGFALALWTLRSLIRTSRASLSAIFMEKA